MEKEENKTTVDNEDIKKNLGIMYLLNTTGMTMNHIKEWLEIRIFYISETQEVSLCKKGLSMH